MSSVLFYSALAWRPLISLNADDWLISNMLEVSITIIVSKSSYAYPRGVVVVIV